MAKSTKKQDIEELEEAVPTLEVADLEPAEEPTRRVRISLDPPTKVYTLDQWMEITKRPVRHLAGIRAFLGREADCRFTLESWDAKLHNY